MKFKSLSQITGSDLCCHPYKIIAIVSTANFPSKLHDSHSTLVSGNHLPELPSYGRIALISLCQAVGPVINRQATFIPFSITGYELS